MTHFRDWYFKSKSLINESTKPVAKKKKTHKEECNPVNDNGGGHISESLTNVHIVMKNTIHLQVH